MPRSDQKRLSEIEFAVNVVQKSEFHAERVGHVTILTVVGFFRPVSRKQIPTPPPDRVVTRAGVKFTSGPFYFPHPGKISPVIYYLPDEFS